MNRTLFDKRLTAAIIDHTAVTALTFFTALLLAGAMNANQQTAPFITIILLVNPLILAVQFLSAPAAYGNPQFLYALFALSFLTELAYYSLFELLPTKKTPGYRHSKLRLETEVARGRWFRIILRNIAKIFSRYLFAIPFILTAVFKSQVPFYDRISGIRVADSEPHSPL